MTPKGKKNVKEEKPELKPGVVDLSPEEGKRSRLLDLYKVDKVYADVKIVEINPELERSISFVYVKRDANGGVVKQVVTDRAGNVKGHKPVWQTEKQFMTPSDFEGFVKLRATQFMLGD